MKTKHLSCALLLLAGSPNAEALSWHWAFNGGPYGGTGTFTTSDNGPVYTITGISGIVGGLAITGLVAPGDYGANDNLMVLNLPQFTAFGVSFTTDQFTSRIYFNAATYQYRYTNSLGGANNVNFTAVPDVPGRVPEPGTLALLGVGLAAVASLRRRQSAAA